MIAPLVAISVALVTVAQTRSRPRAKVDTPSDDDGQSAFRARIKTIKAGMVSKLRAVYGADPKVTRDVSADTACCTCSTVITHALEDRVRTAKASDRFD